MLSNLKIENVLFLDIETVPQHPDHDSLDETSKKLWEHKANILTKGVQTGEEIYQRAGIYAGFIHVEENNREYRSRSFFGDDEAKLLTDLAGMLNSHFNKPQHLLCGHNGKEFDFPYIARRMIINSVKIPRILQISGLKPWEVQHLDTMELWKFGDWKSYTSISLLAHVLGIPTPKDDIDGSDVARVYYEDKDLDRIELYCRKDTLTVAQVLLRMKGEPILSEDEIIDIT
jgi:uncharacterized protein YprB with RNaseH-like and TPR domain